MSSAFRNFFITFAICLLVFGFVGLQYIYPWASEKFNFDDMGENSSQVPEEEVSVDTSEDTSTPNNTTDNEFDENGDVFTAVVMCVDSEGKTLSCAFIDINAKSKKSVYCSIPTSTKVENEIGVLVPFGDLIRTLTPDEICQVVSAMTGIETKYCLRFDREGIKTIAGLMPGSSITLDSIKKVRNPKYEGYIPVGGKYPDDYFITISNVDGKVILNEELNERTKLDWLLEYVPDNFVGNEYNVLYLDIAKSLLKQFFMNESVLNSSDSMSDVINSCDTNLTLENATAHLDTIFSYDDFGHADIVYPQDNNRDNAIKLLRGEDGSYK